MRLSRTGEGENHTDMQNGVYGAEMLLVFGSLDVQHEAGPADSCCSAGQGSKCLIRHLDDLQYNPESQELMRIEARRVSGAQSCP